MPRWVSGLVAPVPRRAVRRFTRTVRSIPFSLIGAAFDRTCAVICEGKSIIVLVIETRSSHTSVRLAIFPSRAAGPRGNLYRSYAKSEQSRCELVIGTSQLSGVPIYIGSK